MAQKFSMFTRGQNAWLENPAEEATVVAAMKAGAENECFCRLTPRHPNQL